MVILWDPKAKTMSRVHWQNVNSKTSLNTCYIVSLFYPIELWLIELSELIVTDS